MSRSEADQHKADLDALRALQTDVSELERIESLLNRFNTFETIVGFDKDEVMHSNFLASLLDPKRTGVLGGLLIKELLRETLDAARKTVPPSAFEGLDGVRENLDDMDLGRTLIRREHQHIDVLLTYEDYKLAVIIENKIWASEGPGQLDWYDRIIRHTHPGWHVHRIYLTPFGATPSHEAYVPFSYGALCDIVDRVVEEGGSALDPEAWVPAVHYARMVRRKILGDPEIVRLAQNLYQKHKRAFDVVYRHPPDVREQIRGLVKELIINEPRLALDTNNKSNIKFGVPEWDTPALLIPERFPQQWTPSRRILLFQFWNDPNVLNLNLFMGPGPQETRQRLLEMVRANEPDVFIMPRATSANWVLIYHRPILKPEVYNELDQGERQWEIRRHWNEFLNNDLPRIDETLKREPWVWESVEPEERI